MRSFRRLRDASVFSQVCPGGRANVHAGGFSLIEVIMATAILLGSVVMLSRLSGIGSSHAQNTKHQAQAQRICQYTMNEIVMGLRPMVAIESSPLLPIVEMVEQEAVFDDAEQAQVILPGRVQDRLLTAGNTPQWLHSIRVKAHEETPGLVSLTVDVEAARQNGTRRIHFSLTRWVRQESQSTPFSDFGGEL